MHAQGQNTAVSRQGQLSLGVDITAGGTAEKLFTAFGNPFHGAFKRPGTPGGHRILGVDPAFHAKATAHIAHRHAHLIARQAQHILAQRGLDTRGHLGAHTQHQTAIARVDQCKNRSRLQRQRRQALVTERQAHHMCRTGEGPGGRIGVTVAHFGRNIVGGLVAHHRRAGGQRLVQVHHHRQFIVVDHHRFGGVAGLLQRVGEHHRHSLANVAHPLEGQRPAQRGDTGCTASAFERGRARNRFDPGSHQISAVKNGHHPWHGQSGALVNAENTGMRVHRPDKTQAQVICVVRVVRDVVSEPPLPLEQLVVFDAEHRVATAKSGVIAIHVAVPKLIGVCAGRPSR